MDIKRMINWKLYFILLTASILSVIAVLPYALTLQGETLKAVDLPIPLLLLISIIQSSVMFAVLIDMLCLYPVICAVTSLPLYSPYSKAPMSGAAPEKLKLTPWPMLHERE